MTAGGDEPTLRESADEIAGALRKELQERLDKAGVVVEETRLTQLSYAPEIAQAMLRRQQAEAVIAARKKSCMARSAWWTWRCGNCRKKGSSSWTRNARLPW